MRVQYARSKRCFEIRCERLKMVDKGICDDDLRSMVFVGETLGELYSKDPLLDDLSLLLKEISDLDAVCAGEDWPFADADSASRALHAMKEGLSAFADEDSLQDLALEYRRLFVGPGLLAAPPWGSVYTDRECVVFGDSAIELGQWMREKGIGLLYGEEEPVDHIGRMLLLMAWIARNQPGDIAEFLEKHLLTWAPHFTHVVERSSYSAFYRGVAILTRSTLKGIQEQLELHVETPRFYR